MKTLPRLTRALPVGRHGQPLTDSALPERILQFGEGNFLRAFVDWMVTRLNSQGLLMGRVVVVQPIAEGLAPILMEQEGLYTVLLRGVVDGEIVEKREVIESISRAINPYKDPFAWLETAKLPEMRFVVSNTTEAGIALDPEDGREKMPSPSFPAKLTQWLYARFSYFEGATDKGVILLPCELIENNGHKLRELVLQLCSDWKLGDEFASWVREACVFTSTLVDRIVTGYPRAEASDLCEEFGYEDRLLVAGEMYHAWVIESPEPLERELPLVGGGLNVTWTTNALPYRERKVRILNGAHTAMTVVGLLAGQDTVGSCMKDPDMRGYVESLLQEEIRPTLEGDAEANARFAAAVLERFENPFVRHELSSIALNSVSKYRARLLGSFVDYLESNHALPRRLCFALSALVVLYRSREAGVSQSDLSLRPKDELRVIEFLEGAWTRHAKSPVPDDYAPLVREILSSDLLWGRDLTSLHPHLVGRIADGVADILAGRVKNRLRELK